MPDFSALRFRHFENVKEPVARLVRNAGKHMVGKGLEFRIQFGAWLLHRAALPLTAEARPVARPEAQPGQVNPHRGHDSAGAGKYMLIFAKARRR